MLDPDVARITHTLRLAFPDFEQVLEELLGLYWGYSEKMEKKMYTTIVCWGYIPRGPIDTQICVPHFCPFYREKKRPASKSMRFNMFPSKAGQFSELRPSCGKLHPSCGCDFCPA